MNKNPKESSLEQNQNSNTLFVRPHFTGKSFHRYNNSVKGVTQRVGIGSKLRNSVSFGKSYGKLNDNNLNNKLMKTEHNTDGLTVSNKELLYRVRQHGQSLKTSITCRNNNEIVKTSQFQENENPNLINNNNLNNNNINNELSQWTKDIKLEDRKSTSFNFKNNLKSKQRESKFTSSSSNREASIERSRSNKNSENKEADKDRILVSVKTRYRTKNNSISGIQSINNQVCVNGKNLVNIDNNGGSSSNPCSNYNTNNIPQSNPPNIIVPSIINSNIQSNIQSNVQSNIPTTGNIHCLQRSNSMVVENEKQHNQKHINEQYLLKDPELKYQEKYFINFTNSNNIQIPKEYANSIYHNLLLEENEGIDPKPEYNYMKNQKEINEQMRSILVDWLIDVHCKFGFTDECLFMTISIIDRYLTVKQVTRTKLQLLGITALMIACKHEEIDLPKVDDFIYITDNAYTREEVFKMENDVFNVLHFSLLFPSPIKFFEYLSIFFGFDKKQHYMGKYLMESFLIDLKNIKYRSSVIACACAYIVMKFFKMKNYHKSYDTKFYSLSEKELDELETTINLNNGKRQMQGNPTFVKQTLSEHDVKDCAKDICVFVDNVHHTNFQACQKKYSKPELEKVALIIIAK